ncbi:OmpL47-type beta-barrel domain-containing protein [Camelliibacillus cellulosilyticus]|uniref:OmpL47-type beta-barrel domain-containing protein n=1 Tax=Camelliibacillus cellulosilyticus TaxID=2174486 RepID=A0ABV9GSM1_9BACL
MVKKWRMARVIIVSLVLVFSALSWIHTDVKAAPVPAQKSNEPITVNDQCPITAVCGPAPHIDPKVDNEHAGEAILFDNTHGQTAGEADWVINGGFSDFAEALANDGYPVQELRKASPMTYDDLKDYKVFVIPESNIPYKASEQAAMLQYVQNGGSIFFIADHYNSDRNKNRWDASEVFNGYRRGAFDDPTKGMGSDEANSAAMQGVQSSDWLADHFGVRFRYNAIGDVNATNIVSPTDAFGITEGVGSVAVHAGSTLAIVDPAHAKGLVYLPALDRSQKWPNAVDEGIYDGGGIAEGPFIAISKVGQGKAAFIGDSSPVEDATPFYLREDTGKPKTTYDGFKEQDDGKMLVNLIEWLSKQEDYTSFVDTGISLDQPTAIHDFEIPSHSTEPKPEPWAPPEPGYEWWNPATFAPGSYGSGELAVNPSYSFVHQDQLPSSGRTFQIRVTGDHLAPFSSVSNLKVGIYLAGGEQVAQFSLDGKTWGTGYGYSDAFSLTADSNGHAEKDLYVKIKPDVLGHATLRIKQGSDKLVSEAVTIADVPVEPLPPGGGGGVPDTIPIQSARAKADGQTVTVHGVITSKPGLYGGQGFYLQDDSGGIYVFQNQPGLQVGDEVTVTAKLDTYHTDRELVNPSVTKTGTGTVPTPQNVQSLGSDNLGQLVEVAPVRVEHLQADGTTGSFEFDAVGASSSIRVRVDSRTGVTLTNFPYKEGDWLDITGISAIWDNVYQLKPRDISDFSLSDHEPPTTVSSIDGLKLSDGTYLGKATLSLLAADEGTGVAKTEFKINGGGWQPYTEPFSIHANGTWLVVFRSVDRAGNVEPDQTLTINVVMPTFSNLYDWIDKSSIHPEGIKNAIKAHVRTAERAKNPRLRVKHLEQARSFVENLSDKHISRPAKSDISAFIQAMLND